MKKLFIVILLIISILLLISLFIMAIYNEYIDTIFKKIAYMVIGYIGVILFTFGWFKITKSKEE